MLYIRGKILFKFLTLKFVLSYPLFESVFTIHDLMCQKIFRTLIFVVKMKNDPNIDIDHRLLPRYSKLVFIILLPRYSKF